MFWDTKIIVGVPELLVIVCLLIVVVAGYVRNVHRGVKVDHSCTFTHIYLSCGSCIHLSKLCSWRL
jgi:hypothetical protein